MTLNGQQRGDWGEHLIRGAEQGSINGGCAHSVTSVTARSCQLITFDVTLAGGDGGGSAAAGAAVCGVDARSLSIPHVTLWGGDTILGGPGILPKAKHSTGCGSCPALRAQALSPHRVWVCSTPRPRLGALVVPSTASSGDLQPPEQAGSTSWVMQAHEGDGDRSWMPPCGHLLAPNVPR